MGGASVRLKFPETTARLGEGGYLLAIRAPGGSKRWLPAIAGVPGERGRDRHGHCRKSLAELMVLARPVVSGEEVERQSPTVCTELTFLAEETLRQLLPEGSPVECVSIVRLTDFFLGLNAGRWLTIRMKEIADAASEDMHRLAAEQQQQLPSRGVADFLDGTGLKCEHRVDPPPEDASHLFEFWGAGGNSGVSGQRIVHEAPPAPASKL